MIVIFFFGQMNSYFQFSEIVLMVIGLMFEFSGWYGFSVCDECQVRIVSISMIMYGIDYIIILIVVEWDYFGLQWVLVLEV